MYFDFLMIMTKVVLDEALPTAYLYLLAIYWQILVTFARDYYSSKIVEDG